MHALLRELFPICRSITGDGLRETLSILSRRIPLKIHEVPSGTKAFDWAVPREWTIRDAYITDTSGRRIVDFQKNNLHVVGYSVPVDRTMELRELQDHLHSLPDLPDAIPYITSYYREYWGFCLSHRQRRRLRPGRYRVRIDSELKKGSLTYGEAVLPGRSRKEIFFSTYVCHPSMANNELSGPVVTAFLAAHLRRMPRRRYTYRFVFIPETIGSIVYLSRNLRALRRNMIAGFNVTCIGDERAYSYLPSRAGDTLADRAALHVLETEHPGFIRWTYRDRGSDERQYCSPGVDLPVASVMRSKYHSYPEYHTSLDDLRLVTPGGLEGGFDVLRRCVETLEHNRTYRTACPCEPQLGRRGLYPRLSTRESTRMVRDMMDVIAYSDGRRDLLGIAETLGRPLVSLAPIADRLVRAGVLREVHG